MKDTNLRIRDAEIEISKLAKSARSATENIEDIQETLQNQQSTLEALESTTNAHKASITTLQSGTVGIANRVTAVENRTTALESKATANQKSIAENTQNITQNTQSLEAHAETLTDFDTSIKFLSNTSSDLLQRVALLEDNAGESSVVLEPRLAEVERKQAEAQIEINALNNALGETKTTVLGLETQVAENK